MARTLVLIGARSGIPDARVRLIDSGDSIVEEIQMNERTNAKMIYEGTISTAPPGNYTCCVFSYDNGTYNPFGVFERVTVTSDVNEIIETRDVVNVEQIGSSNMGSGSDICTMNITVSGNPVADADVWITSDSTGNVVVAGTRQTDSNGNVKFLLDHGSTYYLWMQKDGVESIDGEEFVAQRD